MVYTNPIELPENGEQTEDEITAGVLSGNMEYIPDDNYFRCGYVLLPQEPEAVGDLVEDIEWRDMNEDNSFNIMMESLTEGDPSIPDTPCDNSLPVSSLDIGVNGSINSSPVHIEMNSEIVEEVKQVMVNITLPPSAIPNWANDVPEEQWKEYLFNKLHIKTNKKK